MEEEAFYFFGGRVVNKNSWITRVPPSLLWLEKTLVYPNRKFRQAWGLWTTFPRQTALLKMSAKFSSKSNAVFARVMLVEEMIYNCHESWILEYLVESMHCLMLCFRNCSFHLMKKEGTTPQPNTVEMVNLVWSDTTSSLGFPCHTSEHTSPQNPSLLYTPP